MSAQSLINAVEDLRNIVTPENHAELVQQFTGLVSQEWNLSIGLHPTDYLPLPKPLLQTAAPWLGVMWVIGAPHPYDVAGSTDRRLVESVAPTMLHTQDNANVPVLTIHELAFAEYEDADAFARSLSLGLKATPHLRRDGVVRPLPPEQQDDRLCNGR